MENRLDAIEEADAAAREREQLLAELPHDACYHYGTLREIWLRSREPFERAFNVLLKREQRVRHRGWATEREDGATLGIQYLLRQRQWEFSVFARYHTRIWKEADENLDLLDALPVMEDVEEFWDDDTYSLEAVYQRLEDARK
jgi:hypothetical protein